MAGDTLQQPMGIKHSIVRASDPSRAASTYLPCAFLSVTVSDGSSFLLAFFPHSLDVFFRWLFDKKFLAEAAVRFE